MLLPAPFSPRIACTSPRFTSRSIPSLASTSGNRFVMPESRRSGLRLGATGTGPINLDAGRFDAASLVVTQVIHGGSPSHCRKPTDLPADCLNTQSLHFPRYEHQALELA